MSRQDMFKNRSVQKILDLGMRISFIMGALFLTFVCGASLIYFNLPLAQPFIDAFEGGSAWVEHLRETYSTSNSNSQASQPETKSLPNVGKVAVDQEKTYKGYTLIARDPLQGAYLVDMDGKMVHQWNMPFEKAWPNATHINRVAKAKIHSPQAHVFPNGDLLALYFGEGDTPYGYGLVKMDKNSNVLWTLSQNAHHDFYVEKEHGNVYTLTQEFIKKPVEGLQDLYFPVLADFIIVLSPDGKELQKISILDAFKDSPFELMLYHRRNKEDKKWDWLHVNSVMKLEPDIANRFPLFAAGDILISLRNLDALAVIDEQTHKVKWAYNGIWKAQHSAHFLDNGHILLFDNQGHIINDRPFSRAIEFDPVTLGITWYYAGNPKQPFYSHSVGRTQRLPNGNTLITESRNKRIFEITKEGKTVWDYVLSKSGPTNTIDNATRYGIDDLPFLTGLPKTNIDQEDK